MLLCLQLLWLSLLGQLTPVRSISSSGNFSASIVRKSISQRTDRDSRDRSSRSEHRVYYAIFAGRKEVMEIHFQYTDMMLQLGLVTEVHVWDFTNGNTSNSDYLSSYMRNTKLAGYRVFVKSMTQINHRPSENGRTTYLWYSFYEHYLNNKRYLPQDILIKADDDIVFVDISSFQAFIEAVANSTDKGLHFPNIINNDVGFVVQYDRIHGAPELQKWMAYYTVEPHQFNFKQLFKDYLPHSSRWFDVYVHYGIKMSAPITTWEDGAFTKPEFAQDMHRVFLRNPSLYLHQLHNSELPRRVIFNQRIPINMYAAKFAVIRDIYRLFLDEHCCDDEDFLGAFPTLKNHSHIVHSYHAVSHLASYLQYEQLITTSSILSEYLEMAIDLVAEFRKQSNGYRLKQ